MFTRDCDGSRNVTRITGGDILHEAEESLVEEAMRLA